MTDLISTAGIRINNTHILLTGQKKLELLNVQLATGRLSDNLADYSPSNGRRLLNLNSLMAQREGFKSVINTVESRITIYDRSLTELEEMTNNAATVAHSAQTYNSATNGATAAQIKGFMQQVTFYLNQQVNERYLFAGTRFGTAPVTDLTALPLLTPASSTIPVTDPTLPEYDNDAPGASAAAYVKDQLSVDTHQKLQYGVTSTESGFQKMILGLRFAYSATQDVANYDDLMAKARVLLPAGLQEVRATHSELAAAKVNIESIKTRHTNGINDIKNEIDNIQNIDINEVAVKINFLKAQLEASYAATAQMTNLSILQWI